MNTLEKIKQHKGLWRNNTPCFVYDKSIIIKNLNKFNNLFNGEIAYSLKTNSEKEVIKTINLNRNNFSVCSLEELEILKKVIKNISKVIYYSPSLDQEELGKVLNLGIKRICVDSLNQFNLIIKSPHRLNEVFLRISTELKHNNQKFVYGKDSFLGIHIEEYLKVLEKLKDKKFKLGIHNHLASQNSNLNSWKLNLGILSEIIEQIKKKKLKLNSINLGGGYPIVYDRPIVSLNKIARIINEFKTKTKNVYPNVEFVFEPGRAIIGDAVILIAKVKQYKKFGDKNILIIDASTYNSSMDTLIVGLNLPVKALNNNKNLVNYYIRGRSPDSLDFFSKNVSLPKTKSGDYIFFQNAGAYNFSSDFLHFKKPNIIVVN
ncbi:hypothetical protein HYV89_02560 [Candidatus Woesearchaeota archaeon]|nr:hypothetical protein [Candidatus Woesearchaeota archaeon]